MRVTAAGSERWTTALRLVRNRLVAAVDGKRGVTGGLSVLLFSLSVSVRTGITFLDTRQSRTSRTWEGSCSPSRIPSHVATRKQLVGSPVVRPACPLGWPQLSAHAYPRTNIPIAYVDPRSSLPFSFDRITFPKNLRNHTRPFLTHSVILREYNGHNGAMAQWQPPCTSEHRTSGKTTVRFRALMNPSTGQQSPSLPIGCGLRPTPLRPQNTRYGLSVTCPWGLAHATCTPSPPPSPPNLP